jgi:hypothetical protein
MNTNDLCRLVLEALEMQRQLLAEIRDELRAGQWTCGCGHVNGASLHVCATCGRRPGEIR